MTPYLQARDITVVRGAATVLRSVSIDVHLGEVVALVGPNGAGKSTLLSVLAGDETGASGEVRLDGRPVREWSWVERAQRRAVLTQDGAVAFGYTVQEVVAMGRHPWSGTADAVLDDVAIADAMIATEVDGFRDRRARTLSGGELARVSLARTLAQRAPLMLLDEPIASLDLRHAALVLQHGRAHADRGGAVVAVLHDLNAASQIADRVVVLRGGTVAASGRPDDVLTRDLLRSVYDHDVEVATHPITGGRLFLPTVRVS